MAVHQERKLKTKEVHEVIGKCIDFGREFNCPECHRLLVPVCVNLGTIRRGEDDKLYCTHNFPEDCSQYGCPRYIFVSWLEHYRKMGRLRG